MKIRAAVLREVRRIPEIEEIDIDGPKEGEVLVKIEASGLCRSDIHVIDGSLPEPLPIVLGHEASGVVVDTGPGVISLAPGDHVVLSIIPYCGQCYQCKRGRPNLCEVSGRMAGAGTLADGTSRLSKNGERIYHFNSVSSFADYAVVPESGAIKIDKDVDLKTGALLSCAVMTGVGAVRNTARVAAGSKVVVVGCGGIGQSVIQGARIAGASTIVAVDVRQSSLDLATQLGATKAVLATGENLAEAVLEAAGGYLDYSFEALGDPETIRLGWNVLDSGGTAVIVGLMPKGEMLTIDPWGFISEKSILGCFLGSADPKRDVPELVNDVRSGALNLAAMTTEYVGLEALPSLFDPAVQARQNRVLVVPSLG